MKIFRSFLAAVEVLLVFPAAVFFVALFMRNVQPVEYEPARTAARIVELFSSRPAVGLWVAMMSLPLVALVGGCMALGGIWRVDAELREASYAVAGAMRVHLATLVIAVATVMATGILVVVALHAVRG